MKLPNFDKAKIPKRKLMDYLLSEVHPVGKFKAHYFRTLGFNNARAKELRDGIHDIVRKNEVYEKIKTEFGIKYTVRGRLKCPNGEEVELMTVWIIESKVKVPVLITAYPA